jgi:uncharacterized membrane protein YhaH (DUF805 family)
VTGRIFINYRRGDSQGAAGRLYDRLLEHFKREQLFMDVDAIEPGVDFVKSLDEQVADCSAFVAVIGPGWASAHDSGGRRRLDNPADYVRVELESALKRDIRVIPVLVDGAVMPQPSDLPASLQSLARRNAVEVAHHRFAEDCDHLALAIKRALGIAAPPPTPQPVVSPPRTPAKLTWPEVFLSFRGRIPRGRFLIANIVIAAIVAGIFQALELVPEGVFGADSLSPELSQKVQIVEDRLGTIVTIPFYWPMWALTLKRLHDVGQGWILLLPFVATDIAIDILDLKGMADVSWQVTMFSAGITVALALFKGTAGPNKFGPDPLAKTPPSPTGPPTT